MHRLCESLPFWLHIWRLETKQSDSFMNTRGDFDISLTVPSFKSRRQVPGNVLPDPVLERIMKAQTTESEKTETQVFSVYISMASVKEKRARLSAQLRSLSASAAYNALP